MIRRQLASITALCIFLSSCSAFRSSTQVLTVTTDQPDAQIYINGQLAGHGTAAMPVKRNQNAQILVKKPGYLTIQRAVGKSLNGTGILDIVGGVIILIPLFGLLAPGAYSLDENNIAMVMIRD